MPVGHYPYNATLTFPNRGWQLVAYFCFVVCLVINSGILARRPSQYKRVFTILKPARSTWLADVCVLLTFLVSFCFIVINGVLTFGIGTNHTTTCDASVVLCVSVFVLAKVLMYFYYLERLYILSWVKRNTEKAAYPPFLGRFRTIQWLIGAAVFALGVPCAIALGFSKDFALLYHGETGQAIGCHVFLRWYLAAPTIIWAGIINTYVLVCFCIPLFKKEFDTTTVEGRGFRRVCTSSVWSALVSGVCTVINLSVLLILDGEHGIECLLCCSIDVMVNSLVLSIITDSRGEAFSYPSLRQLARSGLKQSHSDEDADERNYSDRPASALVSTAHTLNRTVSRASDGGGEKGRSSGEV